MDTGSLISKKKKKKKERKSFLMTNTVFKEKSWFEVQTLDPQYLKKKLFLLKNTSLKGEERTRKSSFKNARKQSKMGKQGKKEKVTQVY